MQRKNYYIQLLIPEVTIKSTPSVSYSNTVYSCSDNYFGRFIGRCANIFVYLRNISREFVCSSPFS